MDEQKIQLESRADYEHIRNTFLTHLKSLKDCGKFRMEEIEAFTDKVFEIVQANIQIDGEEFSESTQTLEVEPVDESLEIRLQEIQAETDALLVQVTDYRKKYPQLTAKNYALVLEKALHTIDQSVHMIKAMDPIIHPQRLPDGMLNDYSFNVEKLCQLQSNVPEVVAKLHRARQVLTEEGAKVLHSQSSSQENCTENLTDLINCQRRVERQLDMATKIISQF